MKPANPQRHTRFVVIPPDCDGAALAVTCAELLGEDPGGLRAAVVAGRVSIGDRRCLDPDAALRAGDRVRLEPAPRQDPDDLSPVEILHRDRYMVVVRKPAGLPAQATARGISSVEAAVRDLIGGDPRLVHRLDLPVSGLMALALSPQGATWLGRCFRDRTIRKIYLAKTAPEASSGLPEAGESVEVDLALRWSGRERVSRPDPDGDPARTIFHGLGGPWVLADLLTGRIHQIRVHLASLNASVAGDTLYGGDPVGRRSRPTRISLHAAYLGIPSIQGDPLVLLDLPPDRDPFAGVPVLLKERILSLAGKRR